MTEQCAWCGNLDGQAVWKVVDGVLGGKDGKARRVCRLRDFHALLEGGEEVDLSFCSKAEADLWAKEQGRRFIAWGAR